MPAAMARLHPRYHTPYVALIVQAVISTVILLVSVFFTLSGSQTTVQEAYDILVNLTIIVYFVPYLYLFLALVRLRRLDRGRFLRDGVGAQSAALEGEPLEREPLPLNPDDTHVLRVPGGRPGVWIVATLGFIATLVSLALVFVPPSGTSNVVNYEGNILLQSAVVLGVGLALYGMTRPGRTRAGRSS
jgi:amino acid transporter